MCEAVVASAPLTTCRTTSSLLPPGSPWYSAALSPAKHSMLAERTCHTPSPFHPFTSGLEALRRQCVHPRLSEPHCGCSVIGAGRQVGVQSLLPLDEAPELIL